MAILVVIYGIDAHLTKLHDTLNKNKDDDIHEISIFIRDISNRRRKNLQGLFQRL